MVYYKHLWNLWNGNTWPLYVHKRQVIMHGGRGLTPCNVSKGRCTWCLAQSLSSAWQTFVEFISPQQIDWLWQFTLHLNACSLQGALLYPLHHRADVEAKVGFLSRPRRCYVPATTESVHATNPNPLKLSFSVEVWDNILTCTLNPSWIIITLSQICHLYTNACRQFVAHSVSTLNCRLWRNLRTGEHISRL